MAGPDVDGRVSVLSLIKGLGPGGAERLLLSMALLSDRRRFLHEAAYLLPWKDHLVAPLRAAGLESHCLGVRDERDVRWALRLRRLLVTRRYHVVHLHSPYVAGIARLVIRSLPRWLRPRVVSTEHNVWSSFTTPTRLANRATFPMGDAWLAVTDEARQSIPRRLRDRVEVVVHGVVLDDVRSRLAARDAVRTELGLGPADIAVGTVANLTAQKAYPDLMAAVRLVVDQGLPIRFFAVGQGPLEEELRALHASLGLGEHLVLLGYQEDAVRILAGCDIFTLASHYEGYPVALMEALALGLPVVATGVGGVADAVHHGVEGLLVAPSRPELLAAAIGEVALAPERRARMGEAAARRGAYFDMSVAVARIESIYDALGEHAPGRSSM